LSIDVISPICWQSYEKTIELQKENSFFFAFPSAQ